MNRAAGFRDCAAGGFACGSMRGSNVNSSFGLAVALLVSASVATAASALDYPVRPARLLVGFPAGSSLDIAARTVANKLSELLGQNVIVDNRAGAAGNIAAEIVARARPDGYTLLVGATTLPLMKSGRVRGLAVTSLQRSPLIPDIPAVSESGLKGFEVTGWYGVLAPAGTPRAIIDRLNAALVRAMQMAGVKQGMQAQGISVTYSTPEAFGAFIKSEVAKWAGVVKLAGAKAE